MFKYISDLITFNLFGLNANAKFSLAINFFIYNSLKILFLVFFVVSIITFIRTFIQTSKLKKLMLKPKFGLGNLAASTFGAITPFCSCSSIPIFIGFLEAQVPLGVAFSYLITSPLVNEVAFVIMGGLFGWHLAIIYAVSGILLGVISGIILGALKLEKNIIINIEEKEMKTFKTHYTLNLRIKRAFKEGKNILKKLFPYVLGGVTIGALIHGYVPKEFFYEYIGKYNIFAVPMAVIIGIPIYAGCSMVAPLVFSITASGVPLGTSLAFMMSIAGLSLPEAIILKRVMKFKLLGLFFGIVGVLIIFTGYIFNALVK
jgi:hypothetical protein